MSSSVRWLRDVSPADWIVERLHSFAKDVGSVIPDGFEAYARIFHPVDTDYGPKRWSDIAGVNGRIVHPEMQLHMINRPVGALPPPAHDKGDGFRSGWLFREERAKLVEILGAATTTPDRCWFCVWDGFGGLDDQGVTQRVQVPQRNYLLASGPIALVLDAFEPMSDGSANLWWPEDRAWVVASEIDFAWTYVAGSAAVVGSIVADRRLEAMEARITDRFTYNSDLLNAALDGTGLE